jgi:hypothetical protein
LEQMNYGDYEMVDYKPSVSSDANYVYVELRAHENDYVLEKTLCFNGTKRTDYEVMNEFLEPEVVKVMKVVADFNQMVDEAKSKLVVNR